MNERIRELWDNAAKSTAAYPSGQNNSWETQVNFMEKFAELIVQECLMKAHGAKIRGESMDELIERLKEDFGVEE